MILQKNGKATSSVAASLIERLPDEGDPQRSSDETIAKDVAFVAYAGTYRTQSILDDPLTSLSPVLAGADTVSKRLDNIISLIASLDCIIRANAISGDGTIS